MSFAAGRNILQAVLVYSAWELTVAQLDGDSIRMYFGNGCFFARQHLLITSFEQKVLSRTDDKLSAIAGYAGSLRSGPNKTACYHNSKNFSDYGSLGDAEVVELDVPVASLEDAFAVYFGSFVNFGQGIWARPDPYDQGAEYRSVVGFAGGIANGQVMAAMGKANVHKMALQKGNGSDADTFEAGSVLIMDSNKFRFIHAETCLQFHDDSQAIYTPAYHALKSGLEQRGRIVRTPCPDNFICNSSASQDALSLVI